MKRFRRQSSHGGFSVADAKRVVYKSLDAKLLKAEKKFLLHSTKMCYMI